MHVNPKSINNDAVPKVHQPFKVQGMGISNAPSRQEFFEHVGGGGQIIPTPLLLAFV